MYLNIVSFGRPIRDRHERSYVPLPGSPVGSASRSSLTAACCRRMAAFWRCARSTSALASPIGSPPAWSIPARPDQITHSLAEIIRFRLLMIAAGYEDGNDAEFVLAKRSDVQDGARSRRRRIANCARSRRSRGWKICAGRSRPVADGPRHGRSRIASPFPRFPDASRSTSTTRSTRSMAANSCGCSTPITTNTDFSRSSSSTARACVTAVLRSAQAAAARRSNPSSRRLLRAIRARSPNANPSARRQPLLRPRGSRLVSGERPRLHPRRRADYHVAPACRKSRSGWRAGSKPRPDAARFIAGKTIEQARKLEPGRADHRPRRSRARKDAARACRRHQSEQAQRSRALRRRLLPAQPAGENHIKS